LCGYGVFVLGQDDYGFGAGLQLRLVAEILGLKGAGHVG
jgi:hypothetical protein